MKTRTLVLIPIFIFVVIAIFIFTACNTGENGGGGDPALVGTWIGTEVGHFTTWTMVFQETTVVASTDGQEVYRGNYTAYPEEDPKRFKFEITSSSISQYVGKTSHGIYKIEGDQLTIASNEPGVNDTPTSFTPGGGTRVFELTKQ